MKRIFVLNNIISHNLGNKNATEPEGTEGTPGNEDGNDGTDPCDDCSENNCDNTNETTEDIGETDCNGMDGGIINKNNILMIITMLLQRAF